MPAKKNPIQKLLGAIDRFQQAHHVFGFPYALVKKYGDDEAGYQAALITYYGFLSLFPLLIVATSVTSIIARHDKELGAKILNGINQYFPVVGDQLQTSIHSSGKTGLALVIGLVITLFGAKGIADAVQHALNHIWQVPRPQRPSFPKGPAKSLGLILGGGIGMVGAVVLSGFATALGHSPVFTWFSILVSVGILFLTFEFIFSFGSASHHSWKANSTSAVIAAVGFQILQTFGIVLVKKQLHNLSGAYGQFGFVLAILFWLYLQAQVFMYAAEISTVKSLKLWPRSLTGDPLTPADELAYKLYAQKESFKPIPQETIDVKFKPHK